MKRWKVSRSRAASGLEAVTLMVQEIPRPMSASSPNSRRAGALVARNEAKPMIVVRVMAVSGKNRRRSASQASAGAGRCG